MSSHHDEQPIVDLDQHVSTDQLVEVTPLTKQTSTSTAIDDVPPGDI